jgi:diacylglycerol kinase (ATP)
MVRTAVILNRRAGSAGAIGDLEAALRSRGFEIRETESEGHGRDLAAAAAAEGFQRVVAAGGDGTVSEVVNGLCDVSPRLALGVIPLGTGNDLARTLQIPDLQGALDALDADRRHCFDLMKVTAAGEVRHGINVATGGFSGQVDEVVTDEIKQAWGAFAYLRGAVNVLPDLTGYETVIAFDDGPEEAVAALNVVVANAQRCGGGILVCSAASPEDGLLDVVLVRWASAVELAALGVRLLTGDWIDHPLVEHRQVRQFRLRSRPGMWFNVDGELITRGPISFEVVPGALSVVVGPGYSPP